MYLAHKIHVTSFDVTMLNLFMNISNNTIGLSKMAQPACPPLKGRDTFISAYQFFMWWVGTTYEVGLSVIGNPGSTTDYNTV